SVPSLSFCFPSCISSWLRYPFCSFGSTFRRYRDCFAACLMSISGWWVLLALWELQPLLQAAAWRSRLQCCCLLSPQSLCAGGWLIDYTSTAPGAPHHGQRCFRDVAPLRSERFERPATPQTGTDRPR